MEALQQKIRKHSINSGLLLGLAVFILSVSSFYFSTASTVSSTWLIICVRALFGAIIPITLLVFFCLGVRKKIGGYWNYKQAAIGIFIMLFTAYALFFIGQNIIFAKVIEPDSVQKNEAAAIRISVDLLKKGGASQETIDTQIIGLKKQLGAPVYNIHQPLLLVRYLLL